MKQYAKKSAKQAKKALKSDGKKWQRLRIGFFQTKNEADEFGQDMMSKIKLPAFWSAKIGEIEFGKYAGY